jgi:hypothetical protein
MDCRRVLGGVASTRGLPAVRLQTPKDCKSGLTKEGSRMLDTKIILALALLMGTLKIAPTKPPAGGLPIPQKGAGVGTFN